MPVRLLLLGLLAAAAGGNAAEPKGTGCVPVGRPISLPQVPEASGVAISGNTVWVINDSGEPTLFRLSASGQVTPVAIANAQVADWEDLAIASCGTGECFYIADIGDNPRTRRSITLYQVPMSESSGASMHADPIQARYPDGPHDAEALVVTRRDGAFVVTKENPTRIYALTTGLNPGESGTLKLVRTLPEKMRITGAAASADDRWVALRSNTSLLVYALDAFLNGGAPTRIDLTNLKEPQGEGVAFGGAGEVYLVSEAGNSGSAGTLTRVNCAFMK